MRISSKIVIRLLILAIFVTAFIGIIGVARGYRLNIAKKAVTGTGILVATSAPDAAKIYLNGTFYGVTNSNISLSPGTYTVEIKKEGYSTWKKTLEITRELVVRADALLFPQNPSLSPLTSLGIVKAVYFEKAGKVILLSDSGENSATPAELRKDGIYFMDNARRQLSIFNPLKLLVARALLPTTATFQDSSIVISSDQKEMLFKIGDRSFLLSTEEETTDPFDVTANEKTVLDVWKTKGDKDLKKLLETFKKPFPAIAADAFSIISFSPDDFKILYQAKKDVTIPIIVKDPLISVNQTPQTRHIKAGHIYVYDKKEDRNYEISIPESIVTIPSSPIPPLSPSAPPYLPISSSPILTSSLIWFPDSAHIIMNEGDKISIVDYDNANKQVVYSGPYEGGFVSVTNDGKLLILANLNPQTNKLPDVYAVGIR
ncbi:hypothetical protein A3D80_01590 [Candidatus Roizmanbacteria bacterium RIFCSPHIGHO2_02_FULL_40_13b]|uniref:PEGA domain-containing protein n=1 Tax=Candidatus Roizmanbacteria bacterium RIFCSPHIGHO2_01_FULL_39_24 TaxID=1802032 RepID=A0A1F7GF65_9BACT|nr:MAG: hypothetical protein A2799_00905 [Candidatus Roizmanbacteria bacterium RIFCSPHIGHO2_01_FULL_39_24]OGK26817.1 MAG: hypothetical protein A3D80_01590 [Candidatus Roizmanbacteria bacterium RIFCSPHIGHO2_02_FULL_40_13b]OGK48740.1 MAG: hypothetical protein A3A56_03125 [Candidatus Roizmanbacteria bacterium RIFCSPLOWO2_01_FULL_40_32]